MKIKTTPLKDVPQRWETRQRLRFIESRLYWNGRINRSDLVDFFGISQPQASADLSLYQKLSPSNCCYDKSAKTYKAGDPFKPVFLDPSLDQFLGYLLLGDGFLGDAPELSQMPSPQREVNPDIMRHLLMSIRENSAVKIKYQSMSRPDPSWRWIAPHAFGHDGYRWHVRAFCSDRNSFLDFVVGRIGEISDTRHSDSNPENDQAWHDHVEVLIGPHKRLTPSQADVIEREYNMSKGTSIIRVRKAMLFYVLSHFRLESDAHNPPFVHIRLINTEIRTLIAGLSE